MEGCGWEANSDVHSVICHWALEAVSTWPKWSNSANSPVEPTLCMLRHAFQWTGQAWIIGSQIPFLSDSRGSLASSVSDSMNLVFQEPCLCFHFPLFNCVYMNLTPSVLKCKILHCFLHIQWLAHLLNHRPVSGLNHSWLKWTILLITRIISYVSVMGNPPECASSFAEINILILKHDYCCFAWVFNFTVLLKSFKK